MKQVVKSCKYGYRLERSGLQFSITSPRNNYELLVDINMPQSFLHYRFQTINVGCYKIDD